MVLYVDCEQTAAERMEVHGPIDVNGNITISKLTGSRSTVPVCNNIHCIFLHKKWGSRRYSLLTLTCFEPESARYSMYLVLSFILTLFIFK